MRPVPPRLLGILVVAVAVQAADGQLPRPPRKDLTLTAREFPIPFTGYNQAYRHAMAFSPDGTLLATGAGSRIVVWDVETGKELTRMQLPDEQYAINVAFAEDGKTLVSNGYDDPMIRFWDVKSGKQKSERAHANAPREPLAPRASRPGEGRYRNPFLAFAPGARRMAVYDKMFNHIEVVDPAGGATKVTIDGSSWRGSCTLSADGKLLTATDGAFRRAIGVWDAQTGKRVRTFGEEKEGPRSGEEYVSAHFSHGGKYLMAQREGGRVEERYVVIWGLKDGREYCRMPMWADPGEISPDGRVFLTGSGGRFFLYDLLADRPVTDIKLPTPHFYHVERSPDGKTLALHGLASKGGRDSYSVYLAPFPLLGDEAVPKERLTPADLRDLWAGLSSSNLFRRGYVTDVFKAHADQAVALVEDKVKPAAAADREHVVGLIKKLEDDSAETREGAMKELGGQAFRFEPLLRETFKASPAGETRNRVSFVLNGVSAGPTPADLLADLRGIGLLKALATPAARKLLTTLTDGAPGARVTAEAAGALKRLAK